jgi:protein-serine/threonine kinase
LVTEDGRIQLCDFGISGVLENEVSKRSTIVGTPHWMAPELVSHLGSEDSNVQYGTEIDCWAFGCAVYEMATGNPPNARVRADMLGMALMEPPRLDENKYSAELRAFTAFCLDLTPSRRPSADKIMNHEFIINTSELYPTDDIRRLVENYVLWEQSGGQRASLFNPMGAPGPDELEPQEAPDEEWNFSTTLDFDRRISMRLENIPGFGTSGPAEEGTRFDALVKEYHEKRGETVLGRIFDQSAKPYTYGPDRGPEKSERNRDSDLPLRSYSDASSGDRTTMIDLDDAMPTFEDLMPNLSLAEPSTLKARQKKLKASNEIDEVMYQTSKRDTQDWTMSLDPEPIGLAPEPPNDNYRNRDTMQWTFPQAEEPVISPSQEQTVRASKPAERNTMQWTFPKLEEPVISPSQEQTVRASKALDFKVNARNRKTQEWKFPSAEEMKAAIASSGHTPSFTASDTSFVDAPRPGIKHAKTMPAGSFGDSYDFTSGVSSPDRGSMIDLDDALAVTIPDLSRPSTSHSATDSAVTDMTSRDPFDLEEQLQLSKENSRMSQHFKSQSEPTAGFLDEKTAEREYGSDLDSTHTRSSSMNPSDRERSTSRPAVRPNRPRRPTALQRHLIEKNRSPGSAAASRNGSFDSTKTDSAAGDNYEAWLDEQEHYIGKTAAERRGRRRSRPPPHVPPYEPDPRTFMPSCPAELKALERKRMLDDVNLQAYLAKESMYYILGMMEDFDFGEIHGITTAPIVLPESGETFRY